MSAPEIPPAAPAADATQEPAEYRTRYRRAVTASALGWGLDGFDHTMFPLALGAILATLGANVATGGTISTISLVASAVGGLLGGALADRFGRARVLIWVIIGFSVFTALSATAQNVEQLIVWRVLEGLFFGAEWPVGVALLAEYAKPERRGRVMAFMQSAYSIGWAASTLSYFAIFSLLPPEIAWRVLFCVGLVPALFVLWIRRNVSDRVDRLPAGAKEKANPLAGIREIFRPGLRSRTIVATLFMVGGHGNYYAVVSFLPLYLSTERGLQVSGTTAYLLVQIVGGFVGYVSSGFFHDRFGRRPTQTVAYTLAVASMLLFILTPVSSVVLGLVLVFLVGMCVSSCAGGLGAILSEQFPTSVRGSGLGFSYNVGRGVAAFGPMVIGFMAAGFGLGNSILVVGCGLAVLATVMLWLMPETKGKELVA
ncbi:MFS transporter [Pseudonocardia halophobica]|uniref:MFS transporter n=1 Tax=Pseudonocardia halophobica TaxID=29401 RepID=A0A9W6NXM7_9PSEU|nr:MFS transporter [Pseudonocardia halophobica]GLL13630.1 MFS transporter [Pseudonocardia halophobica]